MEPNAENQDKASAVFNVVTFGAVSDGETLNTEAIQKAVDACAGAGGGCVYFPAGRYLTGAIFLKSHVTVSIDAGATVVASKRFEDFPPFKAGWKVLSDDTKHASLFTGVDLKNIAIVGRGTVDGRGEDWWQAIRKQKKTGKAVLAYDRPRLINLYRCHDVYIQGLRLRNSPSWTVHPIGCEDLVVEGVSIVNPLDSPNTDGINPESCRNVRIANCFIDTGDDCITLKSGKDEEGRAKGVPTENVTITNCVMYGGHGAVTIGSETSGDVRNVVASNIVCVGTDRALRIKSTRGRGGLVENVRCCNFVVTGTRREPIHITNFYTRTDPEPVSERTPVFRDIAVSDFTIKDSPCTAKILGLPEMPVRGVHLSNITATTEEGLLCDSVEGVVLHDVHVNCSTGAPFSIANCSDVELDGVKSTGFPEGSPVLQIEDVSDAFVHGCRAYAGTETFLVVSGKDSSGIVLSGNTLSAAACAVAVEEGVVDGAVVET